MIFIRSDVRHICFKRKNGFILDKPLAKIVYEIVEPVLQENNWTWTDFTKTWDVSVKKDSIVPVRAVRDLNLVNEVAAKVQMLVEMGLEKTWTPEELSIIHFIEAQFLEGKMTWANYKKDWDIRWDHEYQRIVAALLRPAGQVHLTSEEVTQLVYGKLKDQLKEQTERSRTISSDMMSTEIPVTTKIVSKKKSATKSNK